MTGSLCCKAEIGTKHTCMSRVLSLFLFFPVCIFGVCVCVLIKVYLVYNVVPVSTVLKSDPVICIGTFPFLYYLPSWSIPRDQLQVPVLQSRTSLLIQSKCNCLHLLTPNSQSIPLPPLSPQQTTIRSSMTLSLFLFYRQVFVIFQIPHVSDIMQYLSFSV